MWVGFAFGSPVILGALIALQVVIRSNSTLGEIIDYGTLSSLLYILSSIFIDVQLVKSVVGLTISGTTIVAFFLAVIVGGLFGYALAIRKLTALSLSKIEEQKRRERVCG